MRIQAQYLEANKGEVEDITDLVVEKPPYTTGETICIRRGEEESLYTVISSMHPRTDPHSWWLILRQGGRRANLPPVKDTAYSGSLIRS